MSFSIDQKIFKNILDSVKDIAPKNKNNVQEIRLSVDINGLSVSTVNSEETIVVVAFLHKEIFAEYNIKNKNYIDLNVETIRKLISTDIITITFKKINAEKTEKVEEIGITFGKKVKSSYTLKAIDTDATSIEMPENEYSLTFTIDASIFKQLVNRLSTHADTCKILCDDDNLKFIIDSNIVTAEEVISLEDLEDVTGTDLLPIKINSEKLYSILKTNTLSDKIVIEMGGQDNPVCISYIKDNSYMKYYLSQINLE